MASPRDMAREIVGLLQEVIIGVTDSIYGCNSKMPRDCPDSIFFMIVVWAITVIDKKLCYVERDDLNKPREIHHRDIEAAI